MEAGGGITWLCQKCSFLCKQCLDQDSCTDTQFECSVSSACSHSNENILKVWLRLSQMQVHYTVEHKPDLNRSRSAYIKMFSALGKIILTNFLSGANEKACLEEDLFVIPKFICSYILWPSTLMEHPERDGWCSP